MKRLQHFRFMYAASLILLLAACGGGASLDARVLQLSVTYSAGGPVAAEMSGDRGAATSGTTVECRLTVDDKPVVGEAVANEFGAFEMTLDHSKFPQRLPSADEYRTFNDTIECRPQGGTWDNPLRQPVIRVN